MLRHLSKVSPTHRLVHSFFDTDIGLLHSVSQEKTCYYAYDTSYLKCKIQDPRYQLRHGFTLAILHHSSKHYLHEGKRRVRLGKAASPFILFSTMQCHQSSSCCLQVVAVRLACLQSQDYKVAPTGTPVPEPSTRLHGHTDNTQINKYPYHQ